MLMYFSILHAVYGLNKCCSFKCYLINAHFYSCSFLQQSGGDQQSSSLPHPPGGVSSHIALPQTMASRDQTHGIHFTSMTPGGGVTSHKASAIPGRTITSTSPAGSKSKTFPYTFCLCLIVSTTSFLV